MKYFICTIVLVSFFTIIPGYCEDEVDEYIPKSAISIYLLDSYVFTGIAYESFQGSHTGLGISIGVVFFDSEFLVEPGIFIRQYLGDKKGCVYLMAGTSAVINSELIIFNINGGIGLNAIFGSKDQVRLSLEIGPRLSGNFNMVLFLPHFQLMFGYVYNKQRK